MKALFKYLLRRTGLNKLLLKTFSYMVNEAERDKHFFSELIERINKEKSEKKKKDIAEKAKKFGANSFFWGENHTISCPENLIIGENVHIGNNCFIRAEGGVFIGDNTHISRNLVLYSVNHDYIGQNLPYDEGLIKKEVIIGKNVWIGMNVCITPGSIIGDGAIIGMGTTVSGNVPPLTIIGSQKWREIGKRDEEHYNKLNEWGRFGGINGRLYVNTLKTLNEVGDRKNSRRSFTEVIEFNGKKAVKKTFLESKEGKESFEYEKAAINNFQKFNWFPNVFDLGHNFIIYEYYDNKLRLDRAIKELSLVEKKEVLQKIISALIDIFSKDFAHRDFHSKNIFFSKEIGLKIIDFETIFEIEKNEFDFFNSYDIIGIGLESPYLTQNMCVFNSAAFSISQIFQIKDPVEFQKLTEEFLIKKLFEISGSFFTRRNVNKDRHFLRNKYIYNTFDLPYLKVDSKIGQRNVAKRLKKFGITQDQIVGKTILDVGSNIGGVLLELVKMKPGKAIGIEYDKEKVDISNAIAKIHGFKNVEFVQMDVEAADFLENFNEKFEVVFCLAIIEHLKEKRLFFKKLGQLCTKTLFLEGNGGTDIEEVRGLLIKNGFNQVNYIGLSDDEKDKYNNNRPLFVCNK